MAKTRHRTRRGIRSHRKRRSSPSVAFTLILSVGLAFVSFKECAKEEPRETLHVVFPDYPALIDSLNVSAVRALQDLGIRPEWISVSRTGRSSRPTAAARIRVKVPANLPLALCNLEVTKAVQYVGGRVMEGNEDGLSTSLTLAIGMKDSVTSTIILSRDFSIERPEGRVAIIIDDFGQAMNEICRGFLSFDQPLTIAVLPHLKASREVADAAHARGFEVMLHLPLESHDSHIDPGKEAILSSLSSEEMQQRIRDALQSVPHIKGVNNHMGSKITEDEVIMNMILSEIKAEHLFWIDSMTSLHSVAYDKAKASGIRAGRSRLFLDSEPEIETIEAKLKRLYELATTEGPLIAIGHCRPSTLQVLRQEIPKLEKRGITFVFASEMVE